MTKLAQKIDRNDTHINLMKHDFCSNESWIDGSSAVHKQKLDL